jgi:cyclopropane fatty-acyl-phospholipid synthase-like methyltransferase
MSESAGALAAFYDDLSRFHRIWRVARRDDRLTMHRRLLGTDGVASAQVVHERVRAALRPGRGARLLDAGCGLGGTCFDWHDHVGGDCDGVTFSTVQAARAGAAAARRGLARHCRFHLLSYDADLRPLGAFDAIVAIEALAHAADPAATIANLARALRPRGCLAIVDDMPVAGLADDDPDLVAFRAGWRCAHLAREDDVPEMMAQAGLAVVHEEDLTPLMPQRAPARLERLVRLNRRLAALGVARGMLDGQHGGLMLERLYRRKLIRYRLIVAAAFASATCA